MSRSLGPAPFPPGVSPLMLKALWAQLEQAKKSSVESPSVGTDTLEGGNDCGCPSEKASVQHALRQPAEDLSKTTTAARLAVRQMAKGLPGKVFVPGASEAGPLFDDFEVLNLTIKAPFSDLMAEAKTDRNPFYRFDGQVVLENGQAVGIEISPRGNSRRKFFCEHPPWKIWPGANAEGTVFEGQKKLKIVTHCNDGNDAEQRLILEYLAYRLYTTVTDASIRPRLVKFTYQHPDGRKFDETRFGMILEPVKSVAKRLELDRLDMEEHPAPPYGNDKKDPKLRSARMRWLNQYDMKSLLRVAVFQYMVGNTDWSTATADKDKSGELHNMKVMVETTKPDGAPWFTRYPVPYDFDITGLVNPPYAPKNENINVSKRRSMGLGKLAPEGMLKEVLQEFLDNRDDVMAMVGSTDGLRGKHKERTEAYLNRFYEIIEWSLEDSKSGRKTYERIFIEQKWHRPGKLLKKR